MYQSNNLRMRLAELMFMQQTIYTLEYLLKLLIQFIPTYLAYTVRLLAKIAYANCLSREQPAKSVGFMQNYFCLYKYDKCL